MVTTSDIKVTLTHQDYTDDNGSPLKVKVLMRRETLENLEDGESSLTRLRARNVVCAKFRIAAARKYYDGKWPSNKPVVADRVGIHPDHAPTQQRSSQQRASWVAQPKEHV